MDGEKTIEIDPDYKTNNLAIRRVELKNEDNNEKDISIKLTNIIEEEFNKELCIRQEQVEKIEEQIFKTQKLLHTLRYVLISSYYKNNGVEYEEGEGTSTMGLNSIFDSQNRLHPAIKRLCGSNSNPLQILSTSTGKRRNRSTLSAKYGHFEMEPDLKKLKTTPTSSKNVQAESRLNESENVANKTVTEEGSGREIVKNRHKIKRKLVVGNISKWTPTLEDDHLTHKWMVYVRSAKEEVDISTYVEKVVFYLHPSYKPHDVVEVNKSPFHLSRRGWGEFPIRVQVFFKNQLNKPVDIVHNLKLDQTFSGRQTLGNETLVDLFLHDDFVPTTLLPSDDIKLEHDNSIEEGEMNIENVKLEPLEDEDINLSLTKEDEMLFNETTILDHSYCNLDKSKTLPPLTKPTDIDQDKSNRLIYGLDTYLSPSTQGKSTTLNNNVSTTTTTSLTQTTHNNSTINKILLKNLSTGSKSICILPHSLNKLLLANGNLLTLKLKPEVFGGLSQLSSGEVHLPPKERKLIGIPANRYKNMGEILPYLFKKLPLCSKMAEDNGYKCLYPFTARSFDEYSSWYLAKRLNAEWCRAKTILKILRSHQFFESDKWNTKALILYGRSHRFTILVPMEIFNKYSPEIDLVLTCFANNDPNFKKMGQTCAKRNITDSDTEIDVDDSLATNSPVKEEKLDLTDPLLKPACTFIKQTALDCNILLKKEEIMKNVLFNGAERIMLEAMKSFAENIIRRAATHLIVKGNISVNQPISVENVQTALKERPEFEQIVKFRKRKRDIDYFL